MELLEYLLSLPFKLWDQLQKIDWKIYFYFLGLAAAGLLPVKKRPAYRGVSLALALLWGLAATRLQYGDPWTAIAIFESLLFLAVGTFGGKLEISTRNGGWAIAGSVLILYSLLIFPLLDRFAPQIFEAAGTRAPFPLVLFTCGILFFAAGWTTNLLLALPLLWALAAGPERSADAPEIWGLRVALLAAALFLSLLPDLRGGSDRQSSPGAEYRYAYRHRAVFGYGLWALVLITVLLVFLVFAAEQSRTPSPLERITENLVLLCALGIALWLAFSAWQSLWFRYAAWLVSRGGGRIWLWLKDGWRWGVLLLAAAALVTFSADQRAQDVPPAKKTGEAVESTQKPAAPGVTEGTAGSPRTSPVSAERPPDREQIDLLDALWNPFRDLWSQIKNEGKLPFWMLSAAVLVWLSYQAYRGRKRLVIASFADHTGTEAKWVAGLGARLQNELARIADLYKVIDDASPSPRNPVIEVTAAVQDVGEVLKEASSITLGSLKITPNLLAGIVGRIVSGPRLTGALYKVDKEYVLIAELSGGGHTDNWRVDSTKLSEEERRLEGEAAVHKMVEQLAFRIATGLVDIGSPRWRAVRCFTEGLRHCREADRQRRGRISNLREAERCFIRALNDDQRFTQCHYNLGVVYRQLEEFGSAASAFRHALREKPDNFDACYALAETLVHDHKYAEAVWFCDAAIGIDSRDARAWDLQAYAWRFRAQEAKNIKFALPFGGPTWKEILERSEIATALAWRALCGRALLGSPAALETERATSFLCTRNLAVVLSRASQNDESARVFRQASWIAPHDPNLRLYEGRTLFWDHRWEEAEKTLKGVFDDGLNADERGLLWSTLAQVHARSGEDTARRLAHDRFLDLAASANAKELQSFLGFSLEEPPPSDGASREAAR